MADPDPLRYCRPVRSAWFAAAVVVLATSAADASPSNPAFLGISFSPGPGVGAMIGSVTVDSPAARAGLQPGDVIVAVDNHQVTAINLNEFIVAHDAGDLINLAVLRGNVMLQVAPVLTTRAAMFDLLLGKPFTADVDERDGVEVGKSAGHATVVAWYHASGGGGSCIDPLPLVEDIQRRVSSLKASGAIVVGATYGMRDDAHDAVSRDRQRLGMPIMLTSPDSYQRYAIDECGRVFATVVDCHGIVTFMTPISNGDDEDAALDEIATAAAQADHKRH